jgi:hypothetical protein
MNYAKSFPSMLKIYKYAFLFLIVACNEAPTVNPESAEPCVCMKIYQPVCADGVTYGNSCEAECEGHKKWTEGTCEENK